MPLAHAGHWAMGVAMAVPFVAALVWATIATIRERRRGRER
jgi:hypothetical protein